MISNPLIAFVVTFSLAILWLQLNNFAAKYGWIQSKVSRKIIHIGTGPIFVLCWLLFPEHPWSKYLAFIIPGLITASFLLIGLGVIKNRDTVMAMSRTGDPKEILRGPLLYGIIFVVITLVIWEKSPVGIIALMVLCGGDGIADIVGRKVAGTTIPWSNGKTIAGSLAMFTGGFILPLVVLLFFVANGMWGKSWHEYILPVLMISSICTLVETLPLRDWDNVTVPVTAVLVGYLLL